MSAVIEDLGLSVTPSQCRLDTVDPDEGLPVRRQCLKLRDLLAQLFSGLPWNRRAARDGDRCR